MVACIPTHNEEKTISDVTTQACKYIERVLVCDDDSTGMTGVIAKKAGVVVLRHQENMGKRVTLMTLLNNMKELGPEVIVLFDADGEHNPDGIPALVSPALNDEADMTIGSGFVLGGSTDSPFHHLIGMEITNRSVTRQPHGGIIEYDSRGA
jgi:glycosyltransferase involved in cell wall biosynthesis